MGGIAGGKSNLLQMVSVASSFLMLGMPPLSVLIGWLSNYGRVMRASVLLWRLHFIKLNMHIRVRTPLLAHYGT